MSKVLYEEIQDGLEFLKKRGYYNSSLPKSITDNIKQPLRPYQIQALENFIFYNEDQEYKNKQNKHLLFHMATGSGKTNIIASTILYLYEQGYRDFIFFVNTNNIITKTKSNLSEKYSQKYLFNEKILINAKEININLIEDSFLSSKRDDINILFTTTNQLHQNLELTVKEDSITYEDFKNRKVVLIADEAHHLNSELKKKKTKEDEEFVRSWGMTSKRLLKTHKENILLEFTATAEIYNPEISKHYEDKIIYEYPLIKFREDKYSKDIRLINSGMSQNQRILQAIMISEYRQIVAENNHISLKPTVMFKNPKGIKKIDESFDNFVKLIDELSVKDIDDIFTNSTVNVIEKLKESIQDSKEQFVQRLKRSFDKSKCIVIYSTSADKEEILKNLNNLEDEKNHIRAIFAVNILNEGWDVLNLFDIVKLDEAQKSAKSTTSEAQLIGRGARYYPFKYNDEDKYKRKFDSYPDEPLRVLEEMYFHSINQSDYITKLKTELSKIGLIDKVDTSETIELTLKESFINDDLYKNGVVYVNQKKEIDLKDSVNSISDYIGKKYSNQTLSIDNSSSELVIYDEEVEEAKFKKPIKYSIKDFGRDIVRVAINKKPFFYFNSLKKYFPNVKSVSQFIDDENYLGCVEFVIRSTQELELTNEIKINLVLDLLEVIENGVLKNYTEYVGTTEFYPVRISHKIPKQKTLKIQDSSSKIEIPQDWYVFEKHYGTSEEEYFTQFIYRMMNDLESKYIDVKLIRNEKAFEIYSFDKKMNGAKFEPDFVLMLKDSNECYHQVFCEPKGEHLFEYDKWKDEFLKDITDFTNKSKITLEDQNKGTLELYENKCYKIWGLPFYNKELEADFKIEFNNLLLGE